MPGATIENTVVAYLDNEDNPDISNPIHSSEVAKAYGFTGPLVGGVTVWGWATETILEALGEDWLEEGWSEYSFRQPVYPGDILTIRAALNADTSSGPWDVEMINQSFFFFFSFLFFLLFSFFSYFLLLPLFFFPSLFSP